MASKDFRESVIAPGIASLSSSLEADTQAKIEKILYDTAVEAGMVDSSGWMPGDAQSEECTLVYDKFQVSRRFS